MLLKMKSEITRFEKIAFISFPPSLYAIISGSLIGVSTNLLTAIIDRDKSSFYIILSALFYLLSAILFATISIIIETKRDKILNETTLPPQNRPTLLNIVIMKYRILLLSLLFVGILSVFTGVYLLIKKHYAGF